MRYKNLGILGLSFALLLLDWAALHDIIKGQQESYLAEYSMLFVSAYIYSLIAFYIVGKGKKR